MIALIILLLFGGKKIPELMNGLGRGVKSFKNGMNGIDNEVKKVDAKETGNNTKETKGDDSHKEE